MCPALPPGQARPRETGIVAQPAGNGNGTARNWLIHALPRLMVFVCVLVMANVLVLENVMAPGKSGEDDRLAVTTIKTLANDLARHWPLLPGLEAGINAHGWAYCHAVLRILCRRPAVAAEDRLLTEGPSCISTFLESFRVVERARALYASTERRQHAQRVHVAACVALLVSTYFRRLLVAADPAPSVAIAFRLQQLLLPLASPPCAAHQHQQHAAASATNRSALMESQHPAASATTRSALMESQHAATRSALMESQHAAASSALMESVPDADDGGSAWGRRLPQMLARALQPTLFLRASQLDSEALRHVSIVLRHVDVAHIDISQNGFDASAATDLVTAIGDASKKRIVDASEDDEKGAALAGTLQLDVSYVKRCEPLIPLIGLGALGFLDVSGTPVNEPVAWAMLCDRLGRPDCALHTLGLRDLPLLGRRLERTTVSVDLAGQLRGALLRNRSLTNLDLGDNIIPHRAILVFMDAFIKNNDNECFIQWLSLSNVPLCRASMRAVAHMLGLNRSLQFLFLKNTMGLTGRLTDDDRTACVQDLTRVSQQHPTLTGLYLAENQLPPEAVSCIFNALAVLPRLFWSCSFVLVVRVVVGWSVWMCREIGWTPRRSGGWRPVWHAMPYSGTSLLYKCGRLACDQTPAMSGSSRTNIRRY